LSRQQVALAGWGAAVRWADGHRGSIRRPMASGLSDRATAAEEMGTHLAFGDAQTPSC